MWQLPERWCLARRCGRLGDAGATPNIISAHNPFRHLIPCELHQPLVEPLDKLRRQDILPLTVGSFFEELFWLVPEVTGHTGNKLFKV